MRPRLTWLRVEEEAKALGPQIKRWRARLDAVFSPYAWRDLEQRLPLTPEQDAVLLGLIAEIPAFKH